MQNPDIARLLDVVADLLELQNANPFRVRAYRAAARTVRDSPAPLSELVHDGTQRLTELPGIGDDLAEKIRTIVQTGALPLHRQLKRKVPPGVLDLLRVPGLGPKRVTLLQAKLKIRSSADLRQALASGRVRTLKDFGPKLIEKICTGLGQANHVERLLLHDVESHATALLEYLRGETDIAEISVTGSLRRRKETVGDLVVLVTGCSPARIMSRFVAYPEVATIVSRGPTRATVQLAGGVQWISPGAPGSKRRISRTPCCSSGCAQH